MRRPTGRGTTDWRETLKCTVISAVLLTALAAPAGASDTYIIDPVHSDVTFKIRHLVSKVTGRFGSFHGTIIVDFSSLDESSVEFVIGADSIDTGDKNRDQHLRSADFFDTEQHPEITFTSNKITRIEGDRYAVTGPLTLHGVTREVTLPVTFLGEVEDPWGNTKAGFEIATTLDRKDFDITWNKTLDAGGVLLGDEVEISIGVEATRE